MGEVIKEEKGSWFGRLSRSLSLLLPRKLWCCAWRLLQPHNQALLFGYRLKLCWEWNGITSNLFRSADERDRVRLRACTCMLTFLFFSLSFCTWKEIELSHEQTPIYTVITVMHSQHNQVKKKHVLHLKYCVISDLMRFYHTAACVFLFMSDSRNYLWPPKLLFFIWFSPLIISHTPSHQSAGDGMSFFFFFISHNSLTHTFPLDFFNVFFVFFHSHEPKLWNTFIYHTSQSRIELFPSFDRQSKLIPTHRNG